MDNFDFEDMSFAVQARTEGSLRVLEMEEADQLRKSPGDTPRWRALASMYYVDACYANTLWICDNRLQDDPAFHRIRTDTVKRMGLLHAKEWPVSPLPAIPDPVKNRWHRGDWWVARAECMDLLRRDSSNANLWYELAALYTGAEESLMALWCLMTIVCNLRSSDVSPHDISDAIQILDAFQGSGLWADVAPVGGRVDVGTLLSLPVASRTEALVQYFASSGLHASGQAIDAIEVLKFPF